MRIDYAFSTHRINIFHQKIAICSKPDGENFAEHVKFVRSSKK